MNAVFRVYPASIIRGVVWLGRRVRRAPARVALLALVPAAGGLALAASGGPALAAGPAPSCSAGTCTVSFTTPGAGGSFTVPAGVSSLSVTLYGGVGGGTSFGGPAVAGGDGALVAATLTASPGEALGVDVGGAGASSAGDTGAAVAGGANGGGDGFDSGGGGGATDITAGGTRLLVAGGGGGAGTTQPAFVGVCDGAPGNATAAPAAGGAGGNAGNPGGAGQSVPGDSGSGVDMVGGGGGAPGTTSGPGAGGTGGPAQTPGGFGVCPGDGIEDGFRGNAGSGAAGGSGTEDFNAVGEPSIGDAGGGGGGGGYFGGGAGGYGASELSATSTTAGSGGGGGGASYTAGAGVGGASVSDTGNSGQVNGGNGEVVLSYADPVSTSQIADVAVSLSCSSSLAAGQSGACTLTVINHGPATASKLTAVLTLPANVTEVSCTGGCTKSRGLLTWSASSLASGASVSYQATVKAAQPGKAVLLGAAASHNPDPHLLNNGAAAVITVKR